MKRPPLDWITVVLLSAILLLGAVGGWLAISIADREIRLRSTPAQWNTATIPSQNLAEIGPLESTPGSTLAPLLPFPTLTPAPDPGAPASPTLPASHPTLGPNPQTCDECHRQIIHRGGG